MPTDVDAAPWKRLEEIALTGDENALREEADRLGHRETARAISRLNSEARSRVLSVLLPSVAADLIAELTDSHGAALLEDLDTDVAAHILDEMESDETADVLNRIAPDRVEEILREMDPVEAAQARKLTQYPKEVAGGLMITEFLAFPETYTIQELIREIREKREEYYGYSIQYFYVVDTKGKLIGILRIRDLLLDHGDAMLRDVMIRKPLFVRDDAPLDKLEEFFNEYSFFGVPVVDAKGVMIGVVEREDVEEALTERVRSDYMKAQGIVGGDEIRSMSTARRSSRRLSWLGPNIVLNLISASVISYFEPTLKEIIALVVFIPIISDMSGCSGNQAVGVSMRELSLGLIKPFDVFHVWLKEVSVGIINGIVLGILVGLVALVWKGSPNLGIVIGSALAVNTVVAVSFGGVLPLVMRRLKLDPALASGPILTTVTDMCGFFFVLGLATLFLRAGLLP